MAGTGRGKRKAKQESGQKKLEEEKKVLTALSGFPDGETLSKLARSIRLSYSSVRSVIDTLVSTGVVEPCTVRKSNHKTPDDGFRLVVTDQSRTYPTIPTDPSDSCCGGAGE